MMIRLVLLLVLAAACAGDADRREPPVHGTAPVPATATRPPGTATAAPPAQTPVAEITIESVDVANPIVIEGRARTFENNVALRVRDERNALLVEGFTTATGEMGNHNPYRGTLWLTRHPGKKITVEALEYSAKDGSERSLVRRDYPFAIDASNSRLWFSDRDCTRVVEFSRQMPRSISTGRLLVEALIAGPTPGEQERGAVGVFPRGSSVRSINLRDGVMTVDFDESLQNVGGSCRARMIRETVTETLRSLPSVSRVVITAGGSESLALQP